MLTKGITGLSSYSAERAGRGTPGGIAVAIQTPKLGQGQSDKRVERAGGHSPLPSLGVFYGQLDSESIRKFV